MLQAFDQLVKDVWRTSGATDELINLLALKYQSATAFKEEKNYIWLIYVCCLYEKGRREEAADVLGRYVAHYGTEDISYYGYAALLATEVGISNERIDKTKRVFEYILEGDLPSEMGKIIDGRRVAVVGNAGSEIGRESGRIIDEHDVVIRFNNYPTDKYSGDYGNKTDIWVRCGNAFVENRSEYNQYKLIVWETDFAHTVLRSDIIETLLNCMERSVKNVFWSRELRDRLFRESALARPSSGCMCLWTIKELLRPDEIDVYGFSYNDESGKLNGHYYDKLSNMAEYHEIFAERKYLRHLMNLCDESAEDIMSNNTTKISIDARFNAISVSLKWKCDIGAKKYLVQRRVADGNTWRTISKTSRNAKRIVCINDLPYEFRIGCPVDGGIVWSDATISLPKYSVLLLKLVKIRRKLGRIVKRR